MAEIGGRDPVAAQFDGIALQDHPPFEQHGDRGGDAHGALGILLDNDAGDAAPVDRRDPLVDLVDDDGRQAERQLVEQDQLRRRHERPADRDHLLLAAGHLRDRLLASIGEPREQAVDILQRVAQHRPAAWQERAAHQIFLHRHAGEQAAAFRHQSHAQADNLFGRQRIDAPALELDAAGDMGRSPAIHHADDGAQQGRFAGAIRADDGVDRALFDAEPDAVERAALAVKGREAPDGQQDRQVRRRDRHGAHPAS